MAPAPNPPRAAAALVLTSAEAGWATTEIYDALGRRVASLRQKDTTGSTGIDLPMAGLVPGLYTVRTHVADVPDAHRRPLTDRLKQHSTGPPFT